MVRKKYSKELKARIALDAIKGQKTIAELASEYGIHANQISIWKPLRPECSGGFVFVCQKHSPLLLVEGQLQEVWTDQTEEKTEEVLR